MTARVSLLLPLVLAAPGASAQDAAERDWFAGIPNVKFVYYDVSGSSARAVRRDMNRKRPVNRDDGMPADGLTQWTYSWSWRACRLESAELRFEAVVTMPRLVDEATASRPLREQWHRYYSRLLLHEAGHALNAYTRGGEVISAIKAATCETAQDAAMAAFDRIKESDRAYDTRTRHGETQGATFP